jgi:hypothetical protein
MSLAVAASNCSGICPCQIRDSCITNSDSQLGEANGAHTPHDDEPDQTASGNDSAQHGDIMRLGAVGERAHARRCMPRSLLWWDVFDSAEVCGVWKARHVGMLLAGARG